MRKISSIMMLLLLLGGVLSLIVVANAGMILTKQENQKKTPSIGTPTAFYANITFHVYEGEGCGCVPLRGVPINASGRDTEHNTSGVTDDNGTCVLQLEYDKTYRVSIQDKNHETVLFDFDVIEDQSFAFHLKVTDSSHGFSLIQTLLHKIELVKRLIT